MPTNEERREAAKLLRDLASECTSVSDFDLAKALDLETIGSNSYCPESVFNLADLIEPEPENTCFPVIVKNDDKRFEDFYLVECSECKESFGSMFFEKEKAEAFARSLPTYYMKYCPTCGAKVVERMVEW